MPRSSRTSFAQLLAREFPLLPWDDPSRPGPVHILNNFVGQALGPGNLHHHLGGLLKGQPFAGEVVSDTLVVDPGAMQQLLQTAFDSDGNVFNGRSFSSPFPLVADFAGPDPSDSGYGRRLWQSFGENDRVFLSALLASLTNIDLDEADLDPVSRLAGVVAQRIERLGSTGARARGHRDGGRGEDEAPGAPLEYGEKMGELLAVALESELRLVPAQRIEIIRRLGVMLGFVAVLGMLYDPCHRESVHGRLKDDSGSSPGAVLGIVCFTGNPPGAQGDPLADLASRTLLDAVRRSLDGVCLALGGLLPAPAGRDMRRWQAETRKLVLDRVAGEAATLLLEDIVALAPMGAPPSASALVSDLLPEEHMLRSVRTLGVKVGCAGPPRGRAAMSPRFVLETSFLTALVSYVLRDDNGQTTLADFVDRVYADFGLLVGKPSNLEAVTGERLARLAGPSQDVSSILDHARSCLEERLVASRLARRYSDGLVVVERA